MAAAGEATAGEALRAFEGLRLRDLAAGKALRLRDLLTDLLLELLRLFDLPKSRHTRAGVSSSANNSCRVV